MMLEIYQTGKLPPLTVVECNSVVYNLEGRVPYLKCLKKDEIVAMFFVNNIAGIKEIESDAKC